MPAQITPIRRIDSVKAKSLLKECKPVELIETRMPFQNRIAPNGKSYMLTKSLSN